MIIPQSESKEEQVDRNGEYRLKRGARLEDIHLDSASVPLLSSFNGPFQVAEYLSLKVRSDPHDIKGLVDVPRGLSAQRGTDESQVWIYEHLRRIPVDLTPLVTSLLPICTRQSCPEMKANEWMYLCIAHEGRTEECCAIDYILHTLDSTTAMLSSATQFPSRLSIPSSSTGYFTSLFRRLSRIFSHAYYHHREVFALCEVETALYARFVALCEKYELVTQNLLYVPKAATRIHTGQEDDDSAEDDDEQEDEDEEDELEEVEEEDTGRGREKDDRENENKRTRSLDRDRPAKNADIPSRLPPAQTSTQPTLSPSRTASSPSRTTESSTTPESSSNGPTRSETMIPLSFASPHSVDSSVSQKVQQIEEHEAGSESEIFKPPRGGTISRGTTGRGKQPRGTMLWSSDTTPPPLPTQPPIVDAGQGAELSRTESMETAIHVGDAESTEESSTTDASSPVLPKDEIDLLEEAGVLPPVPPTTSKEPTFTATDTAPDVVPDQPSTVEDDSGSANSVEIVSAEVKDLSVQEQNGDATTTASSEPASSADEPKPDTSTPEPDNGANMQTIGPNRKGNRKRGKGR